MEISGFSQKVSHFPLGTQLFNLHEWRPTTYQALLPTLDFSKENRQQKDK